MADAAMVITSIVRLEQWHKFTDYCDHTEDRAAMWAIRECGRRIQKIAKGMVPVDSNTWHAPSTIQRSISNSRNVKSSGDHSFALSVGPHGSPQYMYSGKIEGRYGYMAAAHSAAEALLPSIWEEAQRKMLAKYG